MSRMQSEARLAIILAPVFFAAMFLTRFPLAPKTLYHFDAGSFVLSIFSFNPAISQPQLPGYPLFVALMKLLIRIFPSTSFNLLLAGLLAGSFALTLLFLIADRMFGRRAAWLSVVLLFLNPVFYAAGLTNPLRVFLAAVSLTAAYFAWCAWQSARPASWFVAGASFSGLMCGFRPEMLLLTAPLVLSPFFYRRLSLKSLFCALSAGLLTSVPWQAYTMYRTGGFAGYFHHLSEYLRVQTQQDSLVSGAAIASASILVLKALTWTFFTFSPFLILVVASRFRTSPVERRIRNFLALWFLPIFAFHCLIHIGDPDHTLSTIPVFCLFAGGWMDRWLADSPSESSRVRRWASIGATLTAMFALFTVPLPGILKQTSYSEIRYFSSRFETVQFSLLELEKTHRVAIVCHDSEYPWRNLAAFFFSDPVVVLPQAPLEVKDPASLAPDIRPYYFQNTLRQEFKRVDGWMQLPPVDLIAWPVSIRKEENRARLVQDGFEGQYVLYLRKVAPGEQFQVGGYRFRVGIGKQD